MGSNSMTKFVNGVEGTGPYTKGRHRVKGMCEYDKSIAIKTARNRLLNVVTVFGVTKYFIETVWLFGKTFDWPQSLITTPFEKSWHGFCDKKVEESECGKWKFSVADLKNETVARVREHERCDFELYQTGLDIFMSRLDAASREDKEDLKKFKTSVLLMKNLSATKQNS